MGESSHVYDRPYSVQDRRARVHLLSKTPFGNLLISLQTSGVVPVAPSGTTHDTSTVLRHFPSVEFSFPCAIFPLKLLFWCISLQSERFNNSRCVDNLCCGHPFSLPLHFPHSPPPPLLLEHGTCDVYAEARNFLAELLLLCCST